MALLGEKLSEETKIKMRKPKSKKRILSDEHKKKLGKIWKGKKRPPFSEEWKKNISNAFKGEKSSLWRGGITDKRRYDHERRNREYTVVGFHSTREWEVLKAQYNWTCPCCKKREPDIKLAGDHIIPITKGGSDNIENIQPLCKSCNSKKSNKHSTKYEI